MHQHEREPDHEPATGAAASKPSGMSQAVWDERYRR